MSIHESILDTIGDTPIIRLSRMAPPGVDVFVKVEAANPMGSVKDRLALGIIEAAEQSGGILQDRPALQLCDPAGVGSRTGVDDLVGLYR